MSGSTLSNRPRWLREESGYAAAAQVTGAGNYAMVPFSSCFLVTTTNAPSNAILDLELDDVDIYEREQEFFLQARISTGDVTPAADAYLGLYPVTGVAGNSGARAVVLGAEILAARTPTITLPVANTTAPILKGPGFTLPASGLYLPIIHFSAAFTALAWIGLSWRLGVVAV